MPSARVVLTSILLGAAVTLVVPAGSIAQAYAGGGLMAPVGDLSKEWGVGWTAVLGFAEPVGDGELALGLDGIFARSATDYWINAMGLFGTVGVTPGESGESRPYLRGGAGMLYFDDEEDSTFQGAELGFEAVAGLKFAISSGTNLFLEGRFVGSTGSAFAVLAAGIMGG